MDLENASKNKKTLKKFKEMARIGSV